MTDRSGVDGVGNTKGSTKSSRGDGHDEGVAGLDSDLPRVPKVDDAAAPTAARITYSPDLPKHRDVSYVSY